MLKCSGCEQAEVELGGLRILHWTLLPGIIVLFVCWVGNRKSVIRGYSVALTRYF